MSEYASTIRLRLDRPLPLSVALPPVTRVRGSRMYTIHGRRYLNLWADSGRAVLGLRLRSMGSMLKGMTDRGLFWNLPGIWQRRLENMVRSLLPEHEKVLVLPRASDACAMLGLDPSCVPLEYARFTHDSWLLPADGTPGRRAEAVLVIPPLPDALSPGIIALRTGNTANPLQDLARLPPCDDARLAAACRALAAMQAAESSPPLPAWQAFERYAAPLFAQHGPWLLPRYPETDHQKIFNACLEAGILLSPDYRFPSCVPVDFDRGEAERLLTVAESLGYAC